MVKGAKRQPLDETIQVKRTLIEAFNKLGGLDGLIAWGEKYPTDFYKLWARIMPHEMRSMMQAQSRQAAQSIQVEFVTKTGEATQGTRITFNGSAGEQAGDGVQNDSSPAPAAQPEFIDVTPKDPSPKGL
jgi:head-tail adaptor